MPVAWEYRAPADRLLQFDGVIDASGNLYWSECGAFHSCDVVSVDHEGHLRWRSAASRDPDAAMFVAGDLLVLGRQRPLCGADTSIPVWQVLAAFRLDDGSLAWTRDVVADASAWFPITSCVKGFVGRPTVRGATIDVNVAVEDPMDPNGVQAAGIITLDARTGALLGSSQRTGPSIQTGVSDARSDSAGTRYAFSYPCVFAQTLHAVAADGAERWAAGESLEKMGSSLPLAVSDRWVFDTWAEARDDWNTDRYVRWRRLGDGSGGGTVSGFEPWTLVSAGDYAVLVGARTGVAGFGPVVVALDLSTSSVRWVRPLAPTEGTGSEGTVSLAVDARPILTSTGTVLVVSQTRTCDFLVRSCSPDPGQVVEVDGHGREVFRGALPDRVVYESRVVLDRGRWFVGASEDANFAANASVRAFDLPGRAPAQTGWITDGGNFARTESAR